MLARVRRLLLGLVLIALASAALVLTDRSGVSRAGGGAAGGGVAPKRIAILQISSIDSMTVARDGLVEHLAAAGYRTTPAEGAPAGAGLSTIDLFNAEGDMGTLGQMAAQIVGAAEPYDLVVTLSTPATQSMMRANKRGIPHVFGLVASPPSIGIPLGPWEEGSTRPPNIAGFGTMQPVRETFDLMRACAPSVRRVGTVWNPAEPNAEASIKAGRDACAQLGLELVEANGANVNEVVGAADVVLSRGVDCFWILADTNVIAAAKPLVERCRKAGVPVVTNFPTMAELGAAINNGADYRAMGSATAAIAELVLGGAAPRDLPCENFVPVALRINIAGVPASWRVPETVLARAERVIRADGTVDERAVAKELMPPGVRAMHARATLPRGAGGRVPVVSVITYNRTPNFEETYEGFRAELARLGYEDGRTIKVELRDAQLDAGTLNTIVAAVANERPDAVVPFTTPALQATVRRIKDTPVVFGLVAAAVAAGAGTSLTDHQPNVTGVQTTLDGAGMIRVVKEVLPNLRKAGTVFAPSEANSVFFRSKFEKLLAAEGIELVAAAADRPTELPEAADSLAAQGVEAILQIADNSSATGFPTIVKSADRANLPVFAFTPGAMRQGATLSLALDYRDLGAMSAQVLDRVLRGESTATIPFIDPENSILWVNPERMKRFGIPMPEATFRNARRTDADGAWKDDRAGEGGAKPAEGAPSK